ncbi:hypothetical protein C7S15_0221 [Burkholderia cepacia]|nr:hypothetical protein [Burkholderia cepacia]
MWHPLLNECDTARRILDFQHDPQLAPARRTIRDDAPEADFLQGRNPSRQALLL